MSETLSVAFVWHRRVVFAALLVTAKSMSRRPILVTRGKHSYKVRISVSMCPSRIRAQPFSSIVDSRSGFIVWTSRRSLMPVGPCLLVKWYDVKLSWLVQRTGSVSMRHGNWNTSVSWLTLPLRVAYLQSLDTPPSLYIMATSHPCVRDVDIRGATRASVRFFSSCHTLATQTTAFTGGAPSYVVQQAFGQDRLV